MTAPVAGREGPLRSLGLFVLAASVLVAAAMYWRETEADRAQRQCALYLEAMKQPDAATAMLLRGIYANDQRAVDLAKMLAETATPGFLRCPARVLRYTEMN
jgi:hypothetical protein